MGQIKQLYSTSKKQKTIGFKISLIKPTIGGGT